MLVKNDEALTEEQKKSAVLVQAAVNGTPEEIARVCAEVGRAEYSARALGIACRFRGVEHVRAFVEGGASFHAELTNYMVMTHDCYGENRSVLLLDVKIKEHIPYLNVYDSFCKTLPSVHGELNILPFDKRLEVLDYLIENKEKAEFDPGELLYYAIMLKDAAMTAELEKRGAEFSEYRKTMLTDKGERKDLYIWTGLLEALSEKEFKPVVEQIVKRLDGRKLHCTEGIYYACEEALLNYENLKLYFEIFDKPNVKKSMLMEKAVDRERIGCLEFASENGWLKAPKKRDELIEYARKNKKTECTAFLLDFKNRTADLKAEREKADKKAERILSAAPTSVTAMRELWSWKKLDGGGLMITGYKGGATEIAVPSKIGKDTVTALGMAFSPAARATTLEVSDFRKTITRVTLPETITEICDDAFRVCLGLESVNIPRSVTRIGRSAFAVCHDLLEADIPDGVTEICDETFEHCCKLKKVRIPESLKRIGSNAFWDCKELEEILLPDGLEEIGGMAFCGCERLRSLRIPGTLEKIPEEAFCQCDALEAIVIPDGAREIGRVAFGGCDALKTVEIAGTVENIGNGAFTACGSLESVVIHEGVTEIGGRAFSECPKLSRVELPRSVSKIKNFSNSGGIMNIFDRSPNVTAVVCPKSYAERYCKRNDIPFVYREDDHTKE